MDTFEEIHLAYSFGNSSLDPFVTAYLNRKPAEAVAWICEHIREDFALYHALNHRVQGIQIDLEGGSIDFKIYQTLLDRLRELIPEVKLSITPMSSWVKRPSFQKLAESADLIVPMLYDFKRSRNAKYDLKVTDYHWLQKMVKLYDQLNKPVIYGIPTYSYSIVYDHTGKMEIPWALISPDSATENLRLSRGSMTYNLSKGDGESTLSRDRVLKFQALEKVRFSNQSFQKGSTVKYNFLSPSAVAQYMEAVTETPSRWGRGIAFFRFGVPGEALVLDAWRLKAAINESFGSKIKIKAEIIEGSQGEFFLALTNLGRSTYFGKTGLSLILPPGIEIFSKSSGDFERFSTRDGAHVFEEDFFERREMLITPLLRFVKDLGVLSPLQLVLERSDGITVSLNWNLSSGKKSQTLVY